MRHRIIVRTRMDEQIAALAGNAEHRALGVWAADCAERVLHYFEEKRPADDRPRNAIETLREWVNTGVFRMSVVRGGALAAHAAAREVADDNAARSAARAAGQALATAHVDRHSIAAAMYAATAVRDSANPSDADAAALKEREWQYEHLRGLITRSHESPAGN